MDERLSSRGAETDSPSTGAGSASGPEEVGSRRLRSGPPASVEPRALDQVPRKGVVFRDLVIFQIKLALDGLGDLLFAPLSILAYLWDILFGDRPGRAFYAVLQLGERWDRWLSLYRPGKEADHSAEGLLEAGMSDANTFIGRLERLVQERGGDLGVKDPLRPGGEG